jgi:hypothetical protein
MSTTTTFTTLSADMQNYLERGYPQDTTVSEQIPRLINLAERAIATKLKIQGFLRNVVSVPPSGGLAAGVSVYMKPDRWRETVSMNYGSGTNNNTRNTLFSRSYDYCRNYWPDPSVQDVEQPPKFYADYNYSWWLIVPTPPANFPWEINYYEQPPLLGEEVQTNWLSLYAPNMLLYRCLLEMEMFLKNDERIAVWTTAYEEQISDTTGQDLQKIVDRESVRSKP